MRMSFDQLFQLNADGAVTPRVQVHINGVTVGPGMPLSRYFGGADFTQFRGREFDVEEQGGIYFIKGAYR